MDETLKQIAIQVPSTALVVFFALQVVKMIMDQRGRQMERMIDAFEGLRDEIRQRRR